jgi:hypothetical protein
MERALELDPFNSFYRCFAGWHLIYRREYDRAVERLKATLALAPQLSSVHLGLRGALASRRSFGDALVAARNFFRTLGDEEIADLVIDGSGERAYRRVMHVAAESLAKRAARCHVSAVRITRLYAQASRSASTLQWLETAFERRESPLVHLKVGWDWQPLATHRRFRSLKRELVGHDVKTAPEMTWASKRNGELLALAVSRFDVFVTADPNLSYQQDVSAFDIAVVVLAARSNRLDD